MEQHIAEQIWNIIKSKLEEHELQTIGKMLFPTETIKYFRMQGSSEALEDYLMVDKEAWLYAYGCDLDKTRDEIIDILAFEMANNDLDVYMAVALLTKWERLKSPNDEKILTKCKERILRLYETMKEKQS